MTHDALVVGSGPAGVAAASALLRRGRKVLMLDAGLRLEPERAATVAAMAQVEPSAWHAEQLALIKQGMEPGREGIPLKRMFGSDFPFRETARFADVRCAGSDIKMSLALGGLSNVWGAGAMPFCADDIRDWPLSIEALAPFYRECLEEMDLAAVEDALAVDYPLYTKRPRPLRPSRQAAAFLADLDRNRIELKRTGIDYGTARLAVKAPDSRDANGCVYCGLCLYGCPYGYIYNSADALSTLSKHPNFAYQGDVIVERVREAAGEVTLEAKDRRTGAGLSFSAPQVFLGCGVIPTTAILLASLEAYDRPLEMKDSQYFLCPVLRFRGTPAVERESLHTLAQVFLEIRAPTISAHGIHLSVYTYNDLLHRVLEQQFGPVGRLFPALPRSLARRLLIFGGYLHSDDSPAIELRLRRLPDGGQEVLLQGLPRSSSRKAFKQLMWKLARNTLRFRGVPLLPFARRGLPGRGFHVGGTWPMSSHPQGFQSDLAGRPAGFSNVHLVDATVFPSIPAPNLTLSVMANAKRIVHAACGLDQPPPSPRQGD